MAKTLAEMIMMAKRKSKMNSDKTPKDSTVDLDDEETGNFLDKRNEEIVDEKLFDDGLEDFPQPEDSNLHGHEEKDEHDKSMVRKIMQRMRSKRGV